MICMLDLDNVLNNLQEAVNNVLNERYGTSYTLDNITKYNVSECINKENAIKMAAIYNERGIYDLVKPLPGAQECVQKLLRAGHEIYIVTNSAPSIFEEKVNWIKFYFPDIDEAHIISMKNKWLFKCDVMVEDNLDNLLGGHHYDRVCLNYPWNRDIRDDVYSIHRAYNWDDILNTINDISKMWSDNN